MFRKTVQRIRALVHKSALDRELNEELLFHLDRETEQNIRRGFSDEEARRLALLSFGGAEKIKEECRDVRGTHTIEETWHDFRYAIRILVKRPVFTAIAVVMLALGIGANVAIFSIIQTVLIRPLPYRNDEHLVWLSNRNATLGVTNAFLNIADILDYRQQSKSFENIAAWETLPVNLYGARKPERVEGVSITSNFFRTLGVQPVVGRDFAENDEPEGSVLISFNLWQRQFGGDVGAIGQKLNLGLGASNPGDYYSIVGVLPADSDFPQQADIFMTWPITPIDFTRGGSHNSRTIARLKPGVTIEQAQSEISGLASQQAEQYPDTNRGWDVSVMSFREYLFGTSRTALPLLFAAVVFVLLIACANVANLQLVRAVSRRKEIAIRLALGAGRLRIIRQLLIESLLTAFAGGFFGVILAMGCLYAVRMLGPTAVPRLKSATLNLPALGFAVGLAVMSGIIFGLVPALHASRAEINTTLKDSPSLGTTPVFANRFRRALVVGQISLALILLTGAGLVIKSYWRLQSVDPGLKPDHVLTAGISLSFAEYPNGSPQRAILFHNAVERLKALPGVTSVGAISHLPFGGRTMKLPFIIKGQDRISEKNEAVADYRVVTPSFFETVGTNTKRGRTFNSGDRVGTPQVFVINEAFAQTFLNGQDPIGVRLDGESKSARGEIVGVVENMRHKDLETDTTPAFYVSYEQSATFPIMNFVIRTKSDPSSLSVAVERELQSLDPHGIIFNVRPFEDVISDTVAPRRFTLQVLAIFAALAVILAATGIYGTMSYAVAERTREIGIRVALGARGTDIQKLVVSEGTKLIVLGLIIGLCGSFVLTRWIRSLLFSVSATDPITFLIIGIVLVSIALIACWIPARRATKIEPLVALKYE